MGNDYVQRSMRCFYGVIFSYNELSKIDIEYNEDVRNAAGEIGCEFPDELSNIWEEISNDHYCVYPYYNPIQEDILYVYGEEYIDHETVWGRTDGITTDFTILQKWYSDNKEIVERKVFSLCRRYGLDYRDPEILMLLTVY